MIVPTPIGPPSSQPTAISEESMPNRATPGRSLKRR